MERQLAEISMRIILDAGDARLYCKEALDAVSEFDFETAHSKIKLASEKIKKAHKVQTGAIQGEAKGEKLEHSLLFTHAQDTLMSVYSEINMAKKIIKISEGLDKRLAAIEKGR